MAKLLLGKEVNASINEEIKAKVRKVKSTGYYTDAWNHPYRRKRRRYRI